MRKLFFLVFMLTVACHGTKMASNFSMEKKNITFDRVKLNLVSNTLGNFSLKGYIALIHDSLICFKFYGPFSYEVFKGVYDADFRLFDNYNNKLYSDAVSMIALKSGFTLNRNVLEFMLCSNFPSLISELNRLNSDNLRIETIVTKSYEDIVIFNLKRNSQLKLRFRTKDSFSGDILISYKDSMDTWKFDISILNVTNEPKKCNFGI